MKPINRLILAVLLPLLVLVLPAVATAASLITVCVSGPPNCDTASIQAAINAASFGDTVIVSAGTYTEQLTLKSGVTLTSTDGPTSTVVTSATGPIVLAEAVTATQLSGFTLNGSTILTTAIGLSIVDSEFTLANSRLQHIYGLSGAGSINGHDAIGISITGTYRVTIEQVTVADIQGGNASFDGQANGGSATGMVAVGSGQLIITATQVQALTGGNPSPAPYNPYYCAYAGGDSVGISSQGPATISVSGVSVTGLMGGQPCRAQAPYCAFYGGRVIGIHAISGTLKVQNTTVADLTWWASQSSMASYGIRSQATDETHIERTRISSLVAIPDVGLAGHDSRPTSPSCSPSPGTNIGISLEGGQHASVDHTVMDGVTGVGVGGAGLGLQSDHTTYVTLTHNQLSNLYGGDTWPPSGALQAAGVTIFAAREAEITHNSISQVRGSRGFEHGYGSLVSGGNALGIQVISTTTASLINNLVFGLAGGDGVIAQYPLPQQQANGGHAIALFIERSAARLQNNTLYALRGGAVGQPVGVPGQGIGIDLGSGSSALVLNNAIVSSTVGVSSTSGAYLWDYNALWHNTLNYSGIITGAHDLYMNPIFVDAAHSDLHLVFSSPLVDRGFTPMSPSDDLDGTPRPLDGNGDGVPITDIGAYEYQPTLLQRFYLPVIAHSAGQ